MKVYKVIKKDNFDSRIIEHEFYSSIKKVIKLIEKVVNYSYYYESDLINAFDFFNGGNGHDFYMHEHKAVEVGKSKNYTWYVVEIDVQ